MHNREKIISTIASAHLEALLRYQGELGKVLKLVLAFEEARLDRDSISRLDQLNGDYLASVAWAQEIMAIAG